MLSNTNRPSAHPSIGSLARSGCGMSPATFRLLVADAGDAVERPVRVGGLGGFAPRIHIAPKDLVVCLQPRQGFFVGKVAPFAVGDRQPQQFVRRNPVGERRIGRGRLQEDVLAPELKGTVANQRPGQQPGLAEDLEPVADPQHQPAFRREPLHRLHHRAEPCNGPGAQIIAVAESAGDNDRIGLAQRRLLVPKQPRRMAEHVPQDMDHVLVAIRTGKLEDGEVHLRFTIYDLRAADLQLLRLLGIQARISQIVNRKSSPHSISNR